MEVEMDMLKENTVVTVYTNTDQVHAAFMELTQSGFNINRVSIIGTASRTRGKLAAYYRHGDGIQCWGEQSEFWNRISSNIHEWFFMCSPNTGNLLAIGPIALWMVAVLDNSAIFNGMSVLGATLYSMGLAKERVRDYEEALKKGNYLFIVHGRAQEVTQAKGILKNANIEPPVRGISTAGNK
jgi:hypothetical protein